MYPVLLSYPILLKPILPLFFLYKPEGLGKCDIDFVASPPCLASHDREGCRVKRDGVGKGPHPLISATADLRPSPGRRGE
jgi:hypothetical protein